MISLKGNKKFVVHLFILCLLAITGIFTSAPVYGLNSTGRAELGWSGLTITPDPGMAITLTGISSTSEVTAWIDAVIDFDSQTLSGVSDTSAMAGVSVGSDLVAGHAVTNSGALIGLSEASVGLSTAGYGAGSVTIRDVGIDVLSGNGNITISIPYSLSVEQDSVVAGESDFAGAVAYLELYNLSAATMTLGEDYITNMLFGPGAFLDSRSGTLSTTFYFNAGEYGHFKAAAGAYTSNFGTVAPEPISMVLVGVGMLGLPFVRRFRGFKKGSA